MIVREADRLDRLVGDLMELARLEADDFRLDPVPVDLAALATDAAAVWAQRCADAGVRFDLAGRADAIVQADPDACGRSSTGSPRTRCAPPRGAPLVVATGGDAIVSWLQVRDGGPGFTAETTPSSLSAGCTDRYRGRRPVGSGGVGLALVHGLVVRMGATVAAAPRPRAGLLHRHLPGRRPHSQTVNCTIRIALPKGSRRPTSAPVTPSTVGPWGSPGTRLR